MFAVYSLFASLTLIVLLFLFKRWELSSGTMFFRAHRAKADVFITEHIPQFRRRTIKTSKEYSQRAVISGLHFITSFLLQTVRAVERRLARVVDMIRGRRTMTRQGNASSFLMKVSEHKRVNGTKPNRFSKNVQ